MSNFSSNGIATSNMGLVFNPIPSEPIKTQAGMLVTRAVETRAGWIGQIIIDKTIVWESDPYDGADGGDERAIVAANERVILKLHKIFE